MTEPPERTAETIFLAAREIDSPEGRQHYVQGACLGQPDLLETVQALLAADGPSADFFGRTSPKVEGHGETIGRYRFANRRLQSGGAAVRAADRLPTLPRKGAAQRRLGGDATHHPGKGT